MKGWGVRRHSRGAPLAKGLSSKRHLSEAPVSSASHPDFLEKHVDLSPRHAEPPPPMERRAFLQGHLLGAPRGALMGAP